MGSGQCTAVIGEETAAAGRDQRHLRQAGGPAGGETGGAGGAGAGVGQGKLDRLESQQAGLQTDLRVHWPGSLLRRQHYATTPTALFYQLYVEQF